MSDTSKSNIPEDPQENLNRMKSIADRWETKLASKNDVLERTESRLKRIEELIDKDDADRASGAEVDEEQAGLRKTLSRKYKFELSGDPEAMPKPILGLRKEVSKLKSQVFWARRQQIPFLQSEVKRLEKLKEEEVALVVVAE